MTCELLPIGQSLLVRPETLNNTHDLYGSYKITRIDEKTSEIAVNVSFQPTCDSSEFTNKRIAQAWLNRANQCLENFRPYLLGPDGHQLQFKVISEANLPKNVVKVHHVSNDRLRATSGLYGLTLPCTTILHEVLHLTGLVDEYIETKDDYYNVVTEKSRPINYKCRRPGPNESVMNSQGLALNNAVHNGASLLKPAHYRFIMFPGCGTKNAIYYSCANFAYMASNKNNMCEYPYKVPASCDNSHKWINE